MQSIQLTAQRIKSMCDEKGISVNKMLIESGAGARTYHNMMAGSFPSGDKLSRIADYLNCSVDYLLGRTNEASTELIAYNGEDETKVKIKELLKEENDENHLKVILSMLESWKEE